MDLSLNQMTEEQKKEFEELIKKHKVTNKKLDKAIANIDKNLLIKSSLVSFVIGFTIYNWASIQLFITKLLLFLKAYFIITLTATITTIAVAGTIAYTIIENKEPISTAKIVKEEIVRPKIIIPKNTNIIVKKKKILQQIKTIDNRIYVGHIVEQDNNNNNYIINLLDGRLITLPGAIIWEITVLKE